MIKRLEIELKIEFAIKEFSRLLDIDNDEKLEMVTEEIKNAVYGGKVEEIKLDKNFSVMVYGDLTKELVDSGKPIPLIYKTIFKREDKDVIYTGFLLQDGDTTRDISTSFDHNFNEKEINSPALINDFDFKIIAGLGKYIKKEELKEEITEEMYNKIFHYLLEKDKLLLVNSIHRKY